MRPPLRLAARFLKPWLLAFVLLGIGQSPVWSQAAEPETATAAKAEPRSKRICRATGFLVGYQGQHPSALATCWVVDVKERLVVTNYHTVDSPALYVHFPRFDKQGRVYKKPLGYLRRSKGIKATVLARDARRDLALLRVERLPKNVTALPLAAEAPGVDESVYSMGNSTAVQNGSMANGKLWKYREGKVTKLAPFRVILLTNANQRVEAAVIETNSAIQRGDSGGPLCNSAGEVVGVISGRQSVKQRRSVAIALEEIKGFLADRGKRPQASAPTLQGVWLFTFQKKDDKKRKFFARFIFDKDGQVRVEGDSVQKGKYVLEKDSLKLDLASFQATVPLAWKGNDRFTATFADGKALFLRRR